MRRLTPLKVMAHYDGELDAVEAERVAQALEQDARARGFATELGELGVLLREAIGDRASPDVVPAVMARIEGEPTPRVLVARSRVRRASFALVSGGLAFAAGAFLWFGVRPAQVNSAPVSVARSSEPPPSVAVAQPAGDADAPAVSVEHVDFGAQNGSIFVLDSDKRSVLVVWVVDPADTTTRITPL